MPKARLLRPDRNQSEMRVFHLDSLIDSDHMARVIWAFVESCDLSPLLDKIQAVEGHPGRPAIDPRLLFALWLYANTQGVGSARHLELLCTTSADYQWLCGGLHVCHKTLSAFRSSNVQAFNELLKQCISALMHEGLVTLDLVTLDGVRIRANAGASSFRSEKTLREKLEQASALVADLAKDLDESAGKSEQKQRKRRARAAQEKKQRIEQALARVEAEKAKSAKPAEEPTDPGGEPCQEPEPQKTSGCSAKAPGCKACAAKAKPAKARKPKVPRASTTDVEARIMKMADGGYRPAYNVQVVCDGATSLILSVESTNQGNDAPLLAMMLETVRQDYGRVPGAIIVDGGYTQGYKGVEQAQSLGCEVFGPPRTCVPVTPQSASARSRASKKSEQIKQWEVKMEEEESKAIRKRRAQAAEYANARLRAMDGYQLALRGQEKTRSEMLLRAIAHNVQVTTRIRRNQTASMLQ
jgi:transposase